MDIQARLNRQIEKKRSEIQQDKKELREIEMRIREGEAYIQGMEETLKMIPTKEKVVNADANVRPGSDVAKARDALRKEGSPLRIEVILEKMGKEVTKKHRQALAGQLSQNFRQGRIFTRPEPNTFGLLEWDFTSQEEEDPDLPSTFGQIPDDD
ncbi:MAG: hypothetical protein RL839_10815 [Gammaproteobacteria bacterium]